MTDWDRVTTSAPINKDAALARDGKGVSWEPENKNRIDTVRSAVCLPTRDVTPGQLDPRGTVYGRLTIVGLAALSGRAKGEARWVVRCTCGYYEHRRLKALRKQADDGTAMCSVCEYTEALKADRILSHEERDRLREERRKREREKHIKRLEKAAAYVDPMNPPGHITRKMIAVAAQKARITLDGLCECKPDYEHLAAQMLGAALSIAPYMRGRTDDEDGASLPEATSD